MSSLKTKTLQSMQLEQEIQTTFIANKWSLSLAESCTGGALSARLVQIPDCSLYFLGAVVAYSNISKIRLLKVRQETLEKFGAVSEETAREMAQGALLQFGSDFALATTGLAGPTGATAQKQVGTVCFAISSRLRELVSWTAHFKGTRARVIEMAADNALEHLLDQTL